MFQKGKFLKFRSTVSIHLGQYEKDIPPGVEVEFDGEILIMGGERFSVPKLRYTIERKLGWLVPAEDTHSVYVPRAAPPSLLRSQTGDSPRAIKTISQEERVVSSVSQAALLQSADDVAVGRLRKPTSRTLVSAETSSSVEQEVQRLELGGRLEGSSRVMVGDSVYAETMDPSTGSVVQVNAPAGRIDAPAEPARRPSMPVVGGEDQGGQIVGTYKSMADRRVEARQKAAAAIGDVSDIAAASQRADGIRQRRLAELGLSSTPSDLSTPSPLLTLDPIPSEVKESPPAEIHWEVDSRHWGTRAREAWAKYQGNPSALSHILAVEKPGVCKYLQKKMAESQTQSA